MRDQRDYNLPFHLLIPEPYDNPDEARLKLAAVNRFRHRICSEGRYIKTQRTVLGWKYWDRLRLMNLNQQLRWLRHERRELLAYLDTPQQPRLL